MISIRKSLNKDYKKCEIRNIKPKENIDVIGFVLSKDISTLLRNEKNNLEKILFFNKNLKNIFESNKQFIYLNDNKDINYTNIFNTILNNCKKYVLKNNLVKIYKFI